MINSYNKVSFPQKMDTIYISIYAALVSTTALVWNIISAIRNKQGKITISINLNFAFESSGGLKKLSGEKVVIGLKIINKSENSRILNEPYIEFFEPLEGAGKFVQYTLISMIGTYPKELKRGEVFSYSVEVDTLTEQAFPKTNLDNKFRFVIRDTFDKVYTSNFIAVKDVITMNKVMAKNM